MSGIGGSYEIRGGKKVQREAPTRNHPDGNRARPHEEGTSDEERGASKKKKRTSAQEPVPPSSPLSTQSSEDKE